EALDYYVSGTTMWTKKRTAVNFAPTMTLTFIPSRRWFRARKERIERKTIVPNNVLSK
ncbi:hypothetical protein Bpfe_005372, partial [Biomphalaria pfeifferi]